MEINPFQDFSRPVFATVLYLVLYELTLWNQIYSKVAQAVAPDDELRSFNRFDLKHRHWEMSDRTVANFLEQTPFVLGLLWMHALFISAPAAGTAGFVYIAFRALYPIMWAIKGEWNPFFIELSNQPSYAVLNYFKVSLLWQIFLGTPLSEALPDSSIRFVLSCMGIHCLTLIVIMALSWPFYKALELGFLEGSQCVSGVRAKKMYKTFDLDDHKAI
mmetsp:Transcript_25634/g.35690  ORF Transcript_25634/g.35690 Transcript_25634/m.35690 type:complete len:217 (-) Transcript_25634:129-779(-)